MSNYREDPNFKPPFSIQCPECEGNGYLKVPDGDGETVWLSNETCHKCEGHGVIEDPTEPEYERDEMDED
jgi:DnaJ-class molecular chaperone